MEVDLIFSEMKELFEGEYSNQIFTTSV